MAFQDIGLRVVVQGVGEFRRDMNAIDKLVDDTSRKLDGLGKHGFSLTGTLNSLGDSFTSLGSILTTRVSLPLTALITGMVTAGISAESAFAGVLKTSQGLGDTWDTLTPLGEKVLQQFRALALEIPVSFNELSRIGEIAGQLGVADDQLTGFTEVIAKIGATTDLSTEQAATGFARLANVIGIKSADLTAFTQQAGDAIVELGNNYATTEPEILAMAQRFAGTAHIVGLTTEQILGLAATLTSLGVQTELGGTTVSRIFLEMQSAINGGTSAGNSFEAQQELVNARMREFADYAKQGGTSIEDWKLAFQDLNFSGVAPLLEQMEKATSAGGAAMAWDNILQHIAKTTLLDLQTESADSVTQLKAMADATGLSTEAFGALFRSDPNSAFKLLISSLYSMNKAGTLTKDMLTDMGFGSIRAIEVISKLGGSMDLYTAAEASATKATAEHIALQEEFDKRAATVASQVQLLKNNLFDLSITVFDRLKPALEKVLGLLTDQIKIFKDAISEGGAYGDTIGYIVAGLILLGPTLTAVGLALKGLAFAFSGLGTAFTLITTFFGFIISGPGLVLIGVIAAVAAAFYATRDSIYGIDELLRDVMKSVSRFIDSFMQLSGIQQNFQALVMAIKEGRLEDIPGIIERAWYQFIFWFKNIGIPLLLDEWDRLKPRIEVVLTEIADWIKNTAVPALGKEAVKLAIAFVGWATNLWDGDENTEGLSVTLDTILSNILDWIGKKARDISLKLDDWVTAFVVWILPAAADFLDESIKLSGNITWFIISNAPKFAGLVATEWVPAFSDWTKDVWKGNEKSPGLQFNLIELAGNIGLWIVREGPRFRTTFANNWIWPFISWAGKIWPGVSFYLEGFKSYVGEFIDIMKTWIYDKMVDVGGNIVWGMVDGLAAEAGVPKGRARSIVEDVIKYGFTIPFDINSPSRVTYEIGQNVMQGLADGMESKHSSLISTVTNITNNIVGIAQNAFSTVTGLLSNAATANSNWQWQGVLPTGGVTAPMSTMNTTSVINNGGNQAITVSPTIYNPAPTTVTQGITASFRIAKAAFG